ncbi:MAG TPA: bacillithiol biosynthesis deacetylase BshB1, partial [Calditrichia bacterium]|nr:bacillithiol biosynthesis deacetylase BshB1 [Calditrichia bacterium]
MIEILAFGAHPDDIEIGCGGTLYTLSRKGYRHGMVDLTAGEMGTRGTVAERMAESAEAAAILEAEFRENLGMPDGNIENTAETRARVIALIRRHRPVIVFAPYPRDRHPDHMHASELITEACFYAGLAKVEPALGEAFRPKRVVYYPMSYEFEPSFLVDISEGYEQKVAALQAHRSQFFNPKYQGEATFISSQDYWDALQARARH